MDPKMSESAMMSLAMLADGGDYTSVAYQPEQFQYKPPTAAIKIASPQQKTPQMSESAMMSLAMLNGEDY